MRQSPFTPHRSTFDIRHSRAPMSFETLPYRPCAGMMVLNRAGLAFIGRRVNGPEHVDSTHVWQMPQGGIDPDEDPWPAALRELHEETNISSVQRLGEVAEWLTYDIPREIVGQAWNGKYRGQKQKWFALRFTGDESEIDIAHPAGGHEPEFVEWRWEKLQNLPDLVVPFKRKIYERVVAEFKKFAALQT
jgi:putative (di)nucleoside polyphosphate hydrolase